MPETYIGDGCYVSFDGWQIKLRAPREGGDHEIYLEPLVWDGLRNFADKCWKSEAEQSSE